jgi:hypothetical protein
MATTDLPSASPPVSKAIEQNSMLLVRSTSNGRPGTGFTGQNGDGFLRIAGNLHDVSVQIIALIYYRWTIEIFFRVPKTSSAAAICSVSQRRALKSKSTGRLSRAC